MLGQQTEGIAQIAKETGLTRQTVYRINDDPCGCRGSSDCMGPVRAARAVLVCVGPSRAARPAGLSRRRFKNAVKASAEARVIAAVSPMKAATRPARWSRIRARRTCGSLRPIGSPLCSGACPQSCTSPVFSKAISKTGVKGRSPGPVSVAL